MNRGAGGWSVSQKETKFADFPHNQPHTIPWISELVVVVIAFDLLTVVVDRVWPSAHPQTPQHQFVLGYTADDHQDENE